VLIAVFWLILGVTCLSAEQTTKPNLTNNGITKSHGIPQQGKRDNNAHTSEEPLENRAPRSDQAKAFEKRADTEPSKEDIELQRKLVKATGWLVGVGILQALILVVQALAFFWTLKTIKLQADLMEEAGKDTHDLALQAVRQTNITQAQLELSHRPWVAADVAVASNLIFDGRGAVLMLNITTRNLGASVAKHVSIWTRFVVAGVHDLNQAQEDLCSIMKQPANENSDYGSLLFPGQAVTEPRPVIATQKDVDDALKNGHFKSVNAIGLHLIGCIDYQSTFDPKKHHQTRFVYLVGRIDRQIGAPLNPGMHPTTASSLPQQCTGLPQTSAHSCI
jgi:hypothetical protein